MKWSVWNWQIFIYSLLNNHLHENNARFEMISQVQFHHCKHTLKCQLLCVVISLLTSQPISVIRPCANLLDHFFLIDSPWEDVPYHILNMIITDIRHTRNNTVQVKVINRWCFDDDSGYTASREGKLSRGILPNFNENIEIFYKIGYEFYKVYTFNTEKTATSQPPLVWSPH